MKIAFLGAGKVGAPLAAHLAAAGHEVVLASTKKSSTSLGAALARLPKLRAAALAEAVRAAEVVLLATPFSANGAVLRSIASLLAKKVLVDCTNPVGPGLTHALGSERSGSELVQSLVPEARVVKAFSIYGFESFEDPSFPGYDVRPTMLFCGDGARAKRLVADLIYDCGFDSLDVGGLVQALHLEHMTLLWVRMVRAQGHAPGLVLERAAPAESDIAVLEARSVRRRACPTRGGSTRPRTGAIRRVPGFCADAGPTARPGSSISPGALVSARTARSRPARPATRTRRGDPRLHAARRATRRVASYSGSVGVVGKPCHNADHDSRPRRHDRSARPFARVQRLGRRPHRRSLST
jgi:hypothetical protein